MAIILAVNTLYINFGLFKEIPMAFKGLRLPKYAESALLLYNTVSTNYKDAVKKEVM